MRCRFSPPLIQLAPMEGVLDWVLREMLSEIGGVDRMVTEFVRVTDRLLPDHVFYKYAPELTRGGTTACGTPVFVQLLGGKPGPLAENAARVAELGAPGVDLNFGCPAKTVNRHDGGAALLQHPERLYFICRAVREALPSKVPVTAKVRLGFDHKDYHREIAQAVDEGGASHIVVHARTKREMYTPPAHWGYIRSMAKGRALPFLANGEIWSVDDYWRCREESGVARVALGRGLVARPTLAREIKKSLSLRGRQESQAPWTLGIHDDFSPAAFLNEFFHRSVAYRGEHYGICRLKQILRYWSRDNLLFSDWFQKAKTLSTSAASQEFLTWISRENSLCRKSASTQPTTAPIASAPSNF